MLKSKLEEIAMRVLIALWIMAVRNPRTTAIGVVSATLFAGAHLGFELSPDAQRRLAVAVIIFIGLVAGDTHHRRRKS